MRCFGPALFFVTVFAACRDQQDRILPVLEESDGLEVATLRSIPVMLDPDYMWTFEVLREVRTVRDGDEAPLLFDPSQALALSNGLLLVEDPTADRPLVIIDPDSESAVVRFGSSGQGPGELGGRLTFAEVDGELIILDAGNRQLHRFSLSGEPLSSRAFRSEGCGG